MHLYLSCCDPPSFSLFSSLSLLLTSLFDSFLSFYFFLILPFFFLKFFSILLSSLLLCTLFHTFLSFILCLNILQRPPTSLLKGTTHPKHFLSNFYSSKQNHLESVTDVLFRQNNTEISQAFEKTSQEKGTNSGVSTFDRRKQVLTPLELIISTVKLLRTPDSVRTGGAFIGALRVVLSSFHEISKKKEEWARMCFAIRGQ